MFTITVTVTGLDEAKAKTAALGERLSDFTEALTSLGTAMIKFYSDSVFNTSGEALGSPWRALTDKTVLEKDKKWPGRGILQRTGALQQGFYNDITPMSLFISNNTKTANGADLFAIHQLGTSSGSGRGHNIPARPMIGVNPVIESLIQTVIEADVRAKIDSTMGS